MEVVKSGDALEKQILEDARAKASRIIAEADKECAGLRAEWQRTTEADGARLEGDRDARLAAVRHELGASLPLDFMRARLSHIQNALDKALDEYFAGLSPSDLSRVLGSLLARVAPVMHGASVVVHAAGISPEQARRVVEEKIPGVRVESVEETGQDGPRGARNVGLVLETKDGRIRFRGTLRELGAQLLEQHREELAVALLGKDV